MQAASFSTDDLKTLATGYAVEYHLNVDEFLGTIACESHWDTYAVGDNGTSFGLAQLHNTLTDWGLAPAQAEEPMIALNTMALAWSRGEQGRWSCYKELYGKGAATM